MPDFANLARRILDVANKITPMIPGTTDDLAVAGIRSVVNLIDTFHEVTGSTDAELAAKRDELESRVLKGLEDEADALEG